MASSPRTDIVTHSSVFSVLTTHLLHKATPDGLLAAEMLAAPVGALVSSLLACVAKHPLPSTTASSTLTTTPDSISASTQENAVRLPSSLHAQLSLSMDAIALATLLLCTAQAAQRDAIAPLLPELLGRLHEALESVNGRVASTADSDVERGYRRLKRLLGSWLFGFDVRLLVDEDEAMSQRSPLRGVEVLPLYLMALRCGHCTGLHRRIPRPPAGRAARRSLHAGFFSLAAHRHGAGVAAAGARRPHGGGVDADAGVTNSQQPPLPEYGV